MNDFNDALRKLSEDDAKLRTSPDVEKRLLGAVRNIGRARRRRTWLGGSAIAAVLIIGIALYSWRIGNRPPATEESISEVATEFLPLPYSHVPMNIGSTVRIEVPAAALASFGLAPLDFRKSGTVQADVLIGEDGLARAIRFVRPLRK